MLPPVLDQDLSSVGILLEEGVALNENGEGRGDSGELTPISASASSEFDFEGIKYEDDEEEVEASASADFDITVVEKLAGGGDAPEDPNISKDRLEIDTRNRSEWYLLFYMFLLYCYLKLFYFICSLSKSPNEDKRRPRSGSYLGAKMIGQWVRDTKDSFKGDEEDEGTITSSMTTTSPVRKSIFQVLNRSLQFSY